MISYPVILQAVIPVFILIAIGFAIRRTGFITGQGDEGLMKLCIDILLPALILDKVLGNPLLQSASLVAWSIGLGFGFVILSVAVCYILGPAFGLTEDKRRRTFSITCGITNYGFMALPVMIILFPGDEVLGVLFLHSLGIELAIWTVGITILSGAARPQWRLLANGPVIAIAFGLLLNFTGTHAYIPKVIGKVFETLGVCSVPLGLLLVGASIAELLQRKALANAGKTMTGACLLRLGLLPLPMIAAAATLNIAVELRQVLVVQAAMPAAVFPIVLARHYGGHPVTAIQTVIATTAMSALTMPLVISLAIKWVDVGL